jgi:hypothetical protein
MADLWIAALQATAKALPAAVAGAPPRPGRPEPGQPQSIEALRATAPLLRDDFAEDVGQWSRCEADFIACAHRDGAYVLTAPLSLWGASLLEVDVADFLYEVDARWYDKAEYSFATALLFRYLDEENYYRYEVRSSGEYLLMRRVEGESEVLIEATESPLLGEGEELAARLGIMAVGRTLTLFINGAEVEQVQDSALSHGAIGLYVRAPERTCTGLTCMNPSGIAIAFDNLALWPITQPVQIDDNAPGPLPSPTPEPAPLTLESLNIDWQPLAEEFDITNVRLEESLDVASVNPVTAVVFDFEAVRDVGLVGYTAVFLNDQGKSKTASSVEFNPDFDHSAAFYDLLGGWNAGMRGTAHFNLPEKATTYVLIRLVRNQ